MAVLTQQQICNDPVGPTLITMTIPMIMGILVMFSFQAVDTWYIGRLGTTELAAISFTLPVGFIVNNVAIGLSIGASVIIARAIGSEDRDSAMASASGTFGIALALGGLLAVLGYDNVEKIFTLLGADAPMVSVIRQYTDIWMFGFVFSVITFSTSGIVRATGDTRSATYIMMYGGLINIILDPLLIFGVGPFPRLELQGAAIATVVSLMFSFVAIMWLLVVREKLVRLSNIWDENMARFYLRLARLAVPAALANVLAPVSNAILTRLVSEHGDKAVAAFGAGGRFEQFSMIVAFAITAALSPFMSQNLGAGKPHRAREGMLYCLRFIVFYQLVILLIVSVLRPILANVFSDDAEVVGMTSQYLMVMPLAWLAYGLFVIMNTGFNSAQQTERAFLVSLLRAIFLIAPCAWFGGQWAGFVGIFMGAVLGGFCAAGVSWFLVNRSYRQIIGLQPVA